MAKHYLHWLRTVDYMKQMESAQVVGSEGPVAEFCALREEIQERFRAHQHLLSLQLTLSGAVFGFAVSQPGMITMLLIVPFSSYLLCARLVAQHFAILRVAQYITEELDPRVQGGLGWEQWLGTRQRRPHLWGSTVPLLLTFVAASVLPLVWTAGHVFLSDEITAAARVGTVILWTLGLVATGMSTVLILQMGGRLRGRSWDRANLS